jgi:hypothetical protein
MSIPDNTIHQYDNLVPLSYQLQFSDGTPIDLTTATASLHIRDQDNNIYVESMTITSRATGLVEYYFDEKIVSSSGLKEMEIRLDFDDGTIMYVPSDATIKIEVFPAID